MRSPLIPIEIENQKNQLEEEKEEIKKQYHTVKDSLLHAQREIELIKDE